MDNEISSVLDPRRGGLDNVTKSKDMVSLQFLDYVADKYGVLLLVKLYEINYYDMSLQICLIRYGDSIFHDLVNQLSYFTDEKVSKIIENFSSYRNQYY